MISTEAKLTILAITGATLLLAGIMWFMVWADMRGDRRRKEFRESFMGLSFRIGDIRYTAIDWSCWDGTALCVSPEGKELRVSPEAVIRLNKESK